MSTQAQPCILLTGASGLLGSAITSLLDKRGLPWRALRHGTPGWDPENGLLDPGHLEGVTGVIHLAGENIAAGKWTPSQKSRIRDSRRNGTRALSEAMAAAETKPAFLICASATGYYGDRGDEVCTEASAPGSGFLPDVVCDWESAADPAREAGIRVLHFRLGIVLALQGGALKKMLLPFKLGLGGQLGDGSMWMSWVHIADAARAFVHATEHSELSGCYNLVSPHPVQNHAFAKSLGQALRRPALFPAPAGLIKLLVGEMGEALLLSSTRALPERLQEAGFDFIHPSLPSALQNLLEKPK